MLDTRTLMTQAVPSRRRPPWALIGFAPLVMILLAWQIAALVAPDPLLPPPSAWGEALATIGPIPILQAVGSTVMTFVLGVLLATLIGAGLGVLVGSSPRVARLLNPTLEFLRAVPAPVIVPIAVLAWGSGLATSLFAVAFAAGWPVLMNTVNVIALRPALYADVARTMRLSRGREIATMILPGIIPGALVGFRVAVPLALIVTILVEMLTAVRGVGSLLLTAQRGYDSAAAFGLLCIAGLLGYAVTMLASVLTARALRRWPPEMR